MSRWTLCLAVLALIGCGGEAVVDHSRDPQMFAEDIKELTAQSVAEARTSSEPADALFNLVDMLAELGSQPTGQHLSVYQDIRGLASEIYEDARAVDGRPDGLEERLDRLWALAEQLPGRVEIEEVEDD